jgi:hypothetical protein
MLRNKYVTIIVNGQLDEWTGENPDKYPPSAVRSLARTKLLKKTGKTAYPVLLTEILESDLESGLPGGVISYEKALERVVSISPVLAIAASSIFAAIFSKDKELVLDDILLRKSP